MKIIQINSLCGFGCIGRIMAGISEMLKKNGHECLNVFSRKSVTDSLLSYKINNKIDTYINAAHARLTDREGLGTRVPTLKFLKLMDEYKPDLIQFHNLHGYYINIELLFSYVAEKKIPIIWTLHDEWSYTGHCAYTMECEKWKTECYNCQCKTHYPKSWFVDNSKKNYNTKKQLFTYVDNLTLVTPSEWLGKRAKESFFKDKDIRVIHNGINTNIFKPIKSLFRKKHNIEGKFMILGVSNGWDERKGLKYFIELSKRLSERFVIVIVGMTNITLPKNIIHIPHTDNVEELAEIYSSADVFLNLTLCDNFPTVNIEALACGTPVITYNTGGSPESINDLCGVAVNQHDIDKVCYILNNFEAYAFNSSDVRQHALDFDENIMYNKYIELYEEKVNYTR